MDTKALIEHLDRAKTALKQGESELGRSLVLEVYEAGHFVEALEDVLHRMEAGEFGARARLLAKIDQLIERAQTLREDSEPSSLGMSLSDFFADVPSSPKDSGDALPAQSDDAAGDDFEMIEIVSDASATENLDDHFNFADLGGELSFENLDFSLSSDSEALDDSMLDDIWPEDSMVIEDPSEPIELEEISADLDASELVEEDEEDDLDDLNAFSFDEPEAPLTDDEPAIESEDAQTFDGFFDEIDEQGQWFSTEHNASPEGHEHIEQNAPELDLVEISQKDLSVKLEPGGISGVSETQDGLDVFDIFSQGVSRTDLEPLASTPDSQREEVLSVADAPPRAVSSGLPLPPPILTSPAAPVVPSHHDPEPSPELDFDLDFDDDFLDEPAAPVQPEPVEADPPTIAAPELSAQIASGSTPTLKQEDEDLFDDLFDFDLAVEASSAESEPEPAPVAGLRPPPTHVPEASPSLGFGDLSFGEEASPVAQADPPTRQMDLELLASQDSNERSDVGGTQSGFPMLEEINERETRTMPVVDRDLVNPFEQDDDYFEQPARDEWNFDDDAGGMPGLDDDWLDAPANDSQLPIDPRDVHNDATAIPGLNTSNSNLPFNPYQNSGFPRTPSNPPESIAAQAPPSLKETQEGDVIPINAMSQTLERKEIVERLDEPSPSTIEHDYREGRNPGVDLAQEEEEESDPFDFDLGLHSPQIEEVASRPPSVRRPDVVRDTSTETSVSSTMFGIPFAAAPEPDPKLDAMPTPLPDTSTQSDKDISEDEFFALAESIAAEQSVASLETSSSVPDIRPYRGEPMMRGEPSRGRLSTVPLPPVHDTIDPPPNPFHQQTPTGVRQALVEESSQVSFALEEVEDDELDVGFVPTHLEEDHEVLQLERARKAYDRGHFEESLDMVTPLTSGPYAREANALLASIQSELERLQLERLGSLDKTPVIDMPLDQLSAFNIDHRAGFLLSQIDGFLTFEDILDLSAMSRLETILVLADLLDQKVIKTF